MELKELKPINIFKADCKNYIYDTYQLDNKYVIYYDADLYVYYLQEYNYNLNEFGNVACIGSLQACYNTYKGLK